jgi:preprotein translocase subunit SecE
MAKQIAAAEAKPNLIQRLREFYEEVMVEMHKVTWPTRPDLITSTKVTLFLIAVMAIIMFGYDNVLGAAVMLLLSVSG